MQTSRACVVLLASLAATAPCLARPAVEMALRSCVDGSPALRVPVSTARATLDAADRQRFEAAAQARYPLYQRGGFAAWQVLLMRRDGKWQYVTLWQDGRRGPCFSAVFAADRFDFTPDWLGKYQPHPQQPDD